jgi:hypothetical protein
MFEVENVELRIKEKGDFRPQNEFQKRPVKHIIKNINNCL